jgi:phosphoribosylanthranilate isomerase
MSTRVKICGITRPEDAALAAELGADAIGLNFVGGPRQINVASARTILDALPPMVTAVVLVSGGPLPNQISPTQFLDVNPPLAITTLQVYDWVKLMRGELQFDMGEINVQFNCWMVAHVQNRESLTRLGLELGGLHPRLPAAIVLDTASEKLGGSGRTFNWNLVNEARDAGDFLGLPIILAGGLTPDNVAEAIRIARPYAVDVSSGVEISGKPGVKDPVKMRDFIQAAKNAF